MSTEATEPREVCFSPSTEASIISGNPSEMENNCEEDHDDDGILDMIIDDAELEVTATEWDEGGPSHCGYHQVVHDTLMTVGGSVRSIVGDPTQEFEMNYLNRVGNWFQEASYAVRDLMRGKHDDEEVTSDTYE